ncbi:MAG: hypothetical protein JW874_14420 [Spirochaetales bacterium]|nr:hypothetical protein [Spirochaetales bacterium]
MFAEMPKLLREEGRKERIIKGKLESKIDLALDTVLFVESLEEVFSVLRE